VGDMIEDGCGRYGAGWPAVRPMPSRRFTSAWSWRSVLTEVAPGEGPADSSSAAHAEQVQTRSGQRPPRCG
jgi:hypothetical protein